MQFSRLFTFHNFTYISVTKVFYFLQRAIHGFITPYKNFRPLLGVDRDQLIFWTPLPKLLYIEIYLEEAWSTHFKSNLIGWNLIFYLWHVLFFNIVGFFSGLMGYVRRDNLIINCIVGHVPAVRLFANLGDFDELLSAGFRKL